MGSMGTSTVWFRMIWLLFGIIISNECLALEDPAHSIEFRGDGNVHLSHVERTSNKPRSSPKPKKEEVLQEDGTNDDGDDDDNDTNVNSQPGKRKPKCHFGGMFHPMGFGDMTGEIPSSGSDYIEEYVDGEARRKRKKQRKRRKRRKQSHHYHSSRSLPNDERRAAQHTYMIIEHKRDQAA